jgi:hypothetical protein
MEDNLQWKSTSNGKRLPIEEDLHGRIHPIEEYLQWKNTSNGRIPPMEDDLRILKV